MLPFGMLAWSPENTRGKHNRTAAPGGYLHSATRIRGFSLTHLSGTGCTGASGDVPFMPITAAITAILKDADAPPPLTYADAVKEKYRHPITYFKAAFGLVLLREQIIGPERFDPAFRRYIATWAYKHSSPSDFFRFMESDTGEDLGWFWHGWFEHNWQFDMAVTKATYTDGDYRKGVDITVANLDQLVLPATLELVYDDGSKQDVRVPWETWMQHHSYVIHVDGMRRLKSATIDPARNLPDSDRSNNTVQMK